MSSLRLIINLDNSLAGGGGAGADSTTYYIQIPYKTPIPEISKWEQ